jgi:ADP-ribosylglycohydrolase/protein-tyrosine phosphatase
MLPTNPPSGVREPPGPVSRLAGAVWGHLVGDAIGVPYEGREPGEIGEVAFGASGTYGQPPGTWSDDGALMLALLDALLEPGRMDPEAIGRHALAWYRDGAYTPDGDGRFDIGVTTDRAMQALARGVPALDAGPSDDGSSGNGSLMRILPIALAARTADEGSLVDRAHRASRVTHGHPRAQAACALYTLVLQRLVNWGLPKNAIFAARQTLKLIYLLEARYAPHLAAFNELNGWSERGGRGFVLDSFWSAWDAFVGSSGYEDTVRRAVAYGHDTDTTAAIAAGLAGAHWGWESIPRPWLRGMRGKRIVTPILDRLLERETGTRTSTGSPLRVNEVDLAATEGGAATGGRLAITFLPGKKLEGWTGPHWRDLDTDVARLRELGVDALFLLVEDAELEAAMVLDLPEVLAEAGIELLRFPIRDPEVPADDRAFQAAIRDVLARVRGGAFVAISCRGGLDRSGMAAACVLRESGLDATTAIARVQSAREHALTRDQQQAYVQRWGRDR